MADGPSTPPAPPSGRLIGPEAAAILEQRAIELGINCTSCGLEMSGPGFEFLSLRVEVREGRPTVVEGRVFICHREDCAEAREEARQKSTAVHNAGGWTVITGPVKEEKKSAETPRPEPDPIRKLQ